ncbi:MAG TPA: benzoate-CoA ligase family protein [Acidimicrobiia bacterium]|nr:benzoate-CoA ligase family protein [Acidimicrobiia bacterium]
MEQPLLNMADYFLYDLIREGQGGREAIRSDDGSVTYDDVAALASGMGRRLQQLGVERGQRVLISLPDVAEYVAALFGILGVGAVAVMINPELKPDHLAAILNGARAPVAVVAPAHLEALAVASAVSRHPPFPLILDSGAIEPGNAVFSTAATRRNDPSIWLFSGGTTGVPKIVVQTHGSFVNTTERYARETLGYQPDDVTISVPRLFFGYATGANLLFPFSVGAATVLFPDRPTPAVLFDQIRRHRPTILVTGPSAINAMISDPAAADADLSSLRFATSAGEALPETLYYRWRDRFGIELLDGLGTAEMWHIFVTNRLGDVKVGTVGRVVNGFEVKACDEDGQEMAADEVGRMWVKGDSLGQGYWEDEAQTAAAFRGEWFVGGDLISIDTDGYVTHRGRADDAIKVKGKWLSPQEVESCLLEHPAVKECAVVPFEDDDGLLKPTAFVVTSATVSEAELKQHVLDRLEPYKYPRRVIFVDELPQTHLGKVDRGALKRHARD